MQKKINASIDIMKIGSNENLNNLAGHITRNPQHMKNININLKYSKFNYYKNMGKPINSHNIGHYNGNDKSRKELLQKLDKKHYGNFLKKRNLKYKKQHRLTKIVSFSKFMSKGARQHRVEAQIATLGHKDRQNVDKIIQDKYWQMPKKALRAKELRAWSATMRYYGNHFNKRHKYFKCIGYGSNVDEIKHHTGAPHLHMMIYNQGHTRKGKPSSSFSNAVKLEEHTENNRKAMSKYHRQESKAIIQACNIVLNQRFQHLNLKLSYKPNHNLTTGLNMHRYKLLTTKQNKRLYQNRKNLEKIEKKLNNDRKNHNYYRKSSHYYSCQASTYTNQAQNDASAGLSKANSYIDSGITKGHNYANSGFEFSCSVSQGVNNSVASVNQSMKNKSSAFSSNYNSLSSQLIQVNAYMNKRMKKLKSEHKRVQHLKITKVEQAQKVIKQYHREQQREKSEKAREAREEHNQEVRNEKIKYLRNQGPQI